MAVVTVILGGRARTLADEAVAEQIHFRHDRAGSNGAQLLEDLCVASRVLVVHKVIGSGATNGFGHAIPIAVISNLESRQRATSPADETMLEVVTERPGKITLAQGATFVLVG